jgi:hypothetical protein
MLRIALRAARLRRALDPRASATPQAANAGRTSLPRPQRGHHKTSHPAQHHYNQKSPQFEGIDA